MFVLAVDSVLLYSLTIIATLLSFRLPIVIPSESEESQPHYYSLRFFDSPSLQAQLRMTVLSMFVLAVDTVYLVLLLHFFCALRFFKKIGGCILKITFLLISSRSIR